jgi:hypothetical protein
MADLENSLTRYLRETGNKLSGLAAKMGCPASTLTRPLNGERNPSIALARRVEIATDGRVTAAEFIEICMDARPARKAA